MARSRGSNESWDEPNTPDEMEVTLRDKYNTWINKSRDRHIDGVAN